MRRVTMAVNSRPRRRMMVTVLLYLIVCFTWGTTWLAIEHAVATVPPLMASGLRFLMAFPLFVLFARLKGASLLYPTGQGGLFVLITVCYFSLPYYFIAYGEQYVSAGLAALIFSAMPVFMLLFSMLFLKERVALTQLLGLVLGFGSLTMILVNVGQHFSFDHLLGVFAVLAAAIMHGLCYVITKARASEISAITFNALPIGVAGAAMVALGWVIEDVSYAQISAQSWYALVYLALVASVGGFIVYFHLLQRLSTVVVSYVFIIFPVVAIALDAVLGGDPITTQMLVYAGLMLVGFTLTKVRTSTAT